MQQQAFESELHSVDELRYEHRRIRAYVGLPQADDLASFD